MAVSSTSLAIRYTGNGSTSTPYAIPFPFLDATHIFVSISTNGIAASVLQSQSDFAVTRNTDGSGGSIVSDVAIVSPAVLTIFRSTPLTQPLVLQTNGPLPARSVETEFDRLLMQAQELASRIAGLEGSANPGVIVAPGGSAASEVPTWTNAAARAAVTPGRAGQLGVQRTGQSIWIAQSTTTGDWLEFRPRFTNRLIIGLAADAGHPGSAQDAVANLFTGWAVNAAIFAGDNNYNGAAAYDTDWLAFAGLVAAGKAYPALGNHDIDEAGWQARLNAKFPYLPGNRRYYTVTLGNGLVDLFVLNSGRNSAFDLIEADGNNATSVQHAWFVTALAASTARWKIVVFHHPPASLSNDTSGGIEPNLAWPEFSQVDLICCGHSHLLEILKFDNVQLVNLSSSTRNDGVFGSYIQGGGATDSVLFSDGASYGIGRLIATQEALTVEVWSLGVGYTGSELLHTRDAHDFTLPSLTVNHLTNRISDGFNLPDGKTIELESGSTLRARGATISGLVADTSVDPNEISVTPSAWFKADAITGLSTGATVASWLDSSGNSKTATQATAGFKPTYVTGVLNGLPVVRFDNVDDLLTTPALFTSGYNSAFTAIIVYRLRALDTGLHVLLASQDVNFYMARSKQAIASIVNAAATYVPSDDSTGWAVQTMRYNGAVQSTRVDGRLTYSGASAGTLGATGSLEIGNTNANNYPSNAEIAEVVIYNSAISDAECKLVETGLARKYGLTKKTLTIIGDSIASAIAVASYSWPAQLTHSLGPTNWRTANYAYNGERAIGATQVARAIPDIKPGDVVIYALGSNDVAAGTSAVNIQAQIQSDCQSLQGAGASVIICTILSRQSGGDVVRNAVNTWIRANYTTFASSICDFASEPTMGTDGAGANTTYFSDGTHPTDVGWALMAVVAEDVFRRINGAQRPVALLDGATIATDAARGHEFTVTLAGNRTLSDPVNPTDGQRCVWRLKQDATGSRTITLGSAFRAGPWTATLTLTAAKIDYIEAVYNATDSKWDVVNFQKGY